MQPPPLTVERHGRQTALLGLLVACWLLALLAASLDAQPARLAPEVAGNTDARVLAPAEARHAIEALRTEIAHHDALYHQKAAPEISDYDYDQLKIRLRALERSYPDAAAAVAPVPEIGDDRSGLFQTYRHRERMRSLDKTYAEADVHAFHARLARQLGREDLEYVVEPKFDGFAVSVTFERGRLVRAVTRGNGAEGDDITANVLMIRQLPRVLRPAAADGTANPIPDVVELRGEIYVSFAEFQRINSEREAAGEAVFANPRNLATGTIRQLDPAVVARRNLTVVFYGIGACEPEAARPATQHGLHERLRAWGLPGVEKYWTARGGAELWAAVQALGRVRPGYAFPTDGAVAKLDSVAQQREVGDTDSAPRWAIAYKFAPERMATRVNAITVQVGRTGVLTPVAELAPVLLGGSSVARATLHNRDEIARRDIRVGDFVYVEKAGEIIPAVIGVDLARRPATAESFVFPAVCPACGVAVAQRPDEVAVRCVNPDCPAQLRRRLEHFASVDCVAIDGLGSAIIDTLVERGWVKDIPDLYRLRRADLLTLGRNVGTSTDRLLAAIETSKRAELWRFVYGLSLPQVGATAAKELARRYRSLDAVAALGSAGVSGVAPGDSAGRAAAGFFAEPRHRALVAGLLETGVQPVPPPAAGDRLAGKTFVLTGTLPTLTRAQATAQIEAAGGRVVSAVSRNTHYVVAGAEPGAKLDQARKLGVTVVDEAALRDLLAGDPAEESAASPSQR